MSKRDLKYRANRRLKNLDSTSAGPYIKLFAAILLVAAVLGLTALFAVPRLTAYLKSRVSADLNTAAPTAAVTASPLPHPVSGNPVETLTFSPLLKVSAVVDPSISGDGRLVFSTGASEEDCRRILAVDLNTGKGTEFPVEAVNDALRYPQLAGDYLVYLDLKLTGGGLIRAYRLSTGETVTVEQVLLGAPRPVFENPYLAWMERTDSSTNKLYVAELGTLESVTVQSFDLDSPYGASQPSLKSGQLLYGDADPVNPESSLLRSVILSTGELWQFRTNTFIHDPKSSGTRWVWLTGNHGPDSELYVSVEAGKPQRIARGVANYGITESLVAYSVGETVFAYVFSDGKTYVLSQPGTRAVLLMAQDGYVLWNDVTDSAAPKYNYMRTD